MTIEAAKSVRWHADRVWAVGYKEAAGLMHDAARLIEAEDRPTSIRALVDGERAEFPENFE